MPTGGQNIYADALSAKLRTPITSVQQERELLSDIGMLVVDLSGKVGRMDETIYGNGKTGMRDQLIALSGKMDEMRQIIGRVEPMLEHVKMRKADSTTQEGGTDWFRIFVRYFVDKVLPALIISAIVSYVAFQFALAVFLKTPP